MYYRCRLQWYPARSCVVNKIPVSASPHELWELIYPGDVLWESGVWHNLESPVHQSNITIVINTRTTAAPHFFTRHPSPVNWKCSVTPGKGLKGCHARCYQPVGEPLGFPADFPFCLPDEMALLDFETNFKMKSRTDALPRIVTMLDLWRKVKWSQLRISIKVVVLPLIRNTSQKVVLDTRRNIADEVNVWSSKTYIFVPNN